MSELLGNRGWVLLTDDLAKLKIGDVMITENGYAEISLIERKVDLNGRSLIRWLWTPIPDDEAHRRLDDVDFARMPRMTR